MSSAFDASMPHRTRANRLKGHSRPALAPGSPLPPSSPLPPLTSDPGPQDTELQTRQSSSPVKANDPFGFLMIEKQLKARKAQERERHILQSRVLPNERRRNDSTDSDPDKSDGRPAFATPMRKAALELSSLSPPSMLTPIAHRGKQAQRFSSPLLNRLGGEEPREAASDPKAIARRKQQTRAAKSKGRKKKNNELNRNETEEKENVFAPSSDYLDTLPRPPAPRRTKVKQITGGRKKARAAKNGRNVALTKKAKTGKRKSRNKRQGGGDKDEDSSDESDEVQERVGESFVLDGEEREVRIDRRSSRSSTLTFRCVSLAIRS